MKRFALVLGCFAALSLIAAPALAQQSNEVDPSGPFNVNPQTWTKQAALGTLLAGPFDVETGPFDNRCLGVEEMAGFYFVTGRGHTTTGDNRRIHRYDLNGNYIDSFPQVTNSVGWGGRDMQAAGNTLFVGSDSGEVSEYTWNPGTQTLTHNTIFTGAVTGVTGTTRALCLNPASGNFFTKDFTGNMQEFNLTVGLVNSFANPAISAYGFGWDDTNQKIWSTTTGPGVEDVDPTTGMGMGNTFGPTFGVAQGGADVYEDFRNPGKWSMIILGQGTPDSIELYDLDVPVPSGGGMIGISWSGNVYDIDPGTGASSLVGSSGWSSTNSMGKDSSGRIYSFSGGNLIEINPGTGAGTLVVSTTLSDVRGFAYDALDRLYAVQDNGIGNPDDLYTVNTSTGVATLVGSTGFPGVQGLTFNGGRLYAWDCGSGSGFGDGLITLNTATGAGTDVNVAVGGTCGEVQTLASSPGGQLYGLKDTVYTVNTTTGVLTMVGGSLSDIRGAEFVGGPCRFTLSDPVPGMAGMLNTVNYSCATPNGLIVAVYSFRPGSTAVGPRCPGLFVDMAQPVLGGIGNADPNGDGSFSGPVPGGASGRTVLVQAVDLTACQKSNLVTYTFP